MENIEPFESIYEMLEALVARYGALGISAAMFLESAGVPFASTVVIVVSGSLILRGTVSFWSIFFASTMGITLGSALSYLLGMAGSALGRAARNSHIYPFQHNHHRTSDLPPGGSKISHMWRKYGNFSVFMAQFWGVTRTFISYPAGAMHMKFTLFIIYTFLGGSLFSLLLIALSIALTQSLGLTIKILKALVGLPPWLLFLLPVLLVIMFLLMRAQHHKRGLSTLQRVMQKMISRPRLKQAGRFFSRRKNRERDCR